MRLTFNRNWNGSLGEVTYRLDLTDEEQHLVEKFDLGRNRVSVGYQNTTFADLIRGVTIQPPSTQEIVMLRHTDNELIERCDEFCRWLDYCRSFEETVIEYPREDSFRAN